MACTQVVYSSQVFTLVAHCTVPWMYSRKGIRCDSYALRHSSAASALDADSHFIVIATNEAQSSDSGAALLLQAINATNAAIQIRIPASIFATRPRASASEPPLTRLRFETRRVLAAFC